MLIFSIVFISVLFQGFVLYNQNRKDKFHEFLMDAVFTRGNISPLASYEKFFESKFWDNDFEKMIVTRN